MNPFRSIFSLGLLFVTAVAEPPGYRSEPYRAPTPATLAGASVLDTEAVHALWIAQKAVFVDVLPRSPRPAGLSGSTIWRPKPRSDIPGSIWLPDTGYDNLAAVVEQYFKNGLEAASAGDRRRTLVFYCLENCWMSWNAAKRALSYGYSNIVWYPAGTDGWEAKGFPLESRQPVPRPGQGE